MTRRRSTYIRPPRRRVDSETLWLVAMICLLTPPFGFLITVWAIAVAKGWL